ncbi:MAG TPA: 30S ribosome-binding factor RbfA [Acidimicrobiia bacterium]|nr:30S ribosome-binding factor RbfA [Acidimicrobiia bacterium]
MANAARRYERTARVNEVLREVVAEELERLSDPRFGLVTVTGVEATPDLRQATVYYSALHPPQAPGRRKAEPTAEERAEAAEVTAAALRAAGPHLQSVIGRQVRMKYTPHLVFREDPAIRTGERVDEILRQLHSEDE